MAVVVFRGIIRRWWSQHSSSTPSAYHVSAHLPTPARPTLLLCTAFRWKGGTVPRVAPPILPVDDECGVLMIALSLFLFFRDPAHVARIDRGKPKRP